jgi:acetylornithine deacetylase/succinyl-diaminopimelate desuccinylase-like protein
LKIREETMPASTIDWDAVAADAAATMSRYAQFDTTNPPGNEMPAAEWLADQLVARGITRDAAIHEPAPGRGLVLARIPGSEPAARPLLINHHMDVVPADPAHWTHPPFSGAVADGFVWGRGTLDTKSLGVIFLFALETLIKEGVRFRRPVVFLAVPDEETGGVHGMRWLVEHHGEALDPEWVWDEGSGGLKGVFGEGVMFAVAVAEKRIHQLKLTATGKPGHASMPHNDNANVTLLNGLHRVLSDPRPLHVHEVVAAMLRSVAASGALPAALLDNLDNPAVAGQLAADPMLNAVLRDTLSLTILRAGHKVNVIPERAEAEIDCRLLPDTDGEEFRGWLRERLADERITVELMQSSSASGVAPLDNPFYRAVEHAVAVHEPAAGVFPLLVAGATDGRYWRGRGYAAYGFSPTILTREDVGRIHGIDERISVENLVLGIRMARDIIRELCAA